MAFFEGNKMTAGYGDGPDIISSCSIKVNRGEIVAILGPNGAGKSTAMKAMFGLLNLKSGNIIFDGLDISKISPQDRVKQGVSFVPQNKNVFAELTVRENLEIGGFLRKDGLEKKYGFAKHLHNSLPNATYVGFTGTPIDKTIDVFGDVVDAYTMKESVNDQITVKIVYEGRAAKVLLDSKKIQEIKQYIGF